VTPEIAARVAAFEARKNAARTPVAAATTATTIFKPNTEVLTMQLDKTLTVRNDQLRRHLDLPDYADEMTIRAALRCAPPFKEIQAAAASRRPAVRAAAPAPRPAPLLDVTNLRASSDAELRSLAASPLATSDRAAVLEELSHRQLMATAYPGAAKSPDGRVRIHHAA